MNNKLVFISHSSKDAKIAKEICTFLEKEGIECWIAPRDVRPGFDYDDEIVLGLEKTKALIFLLSSNSNLSRHAKSEIDIAVNRHHAIFPVRIENIEPIGGLAFWLKSPHWTDAFPPPYDQKLQILIQTIKQFLEINESNKSDIAEIEKKEENFERITPIENGFVYESNLQKIDSSQTLKDNAELRALFNDAIASMDARYYEPNWGSARMTDTNSNEIWKKLQTNFSADEIQILCEIANDENYHLKVSRGSAEWIRWLRITLLLSYALSEKTLKKHQKLILDALRGPWSVDQEIQRETRMPYLLASLPIPPKDKWEYIYTLIDPQIGDANQFLIEAIIDTTPPQFREKTSSKIISIIEASNDDYLINISISALKKLNMKNEIVRLRECLTSAARPSKIRSICNLLIEWKDLEADSYIQEVIEYRRYTSDSQLLANLCNALLTLDQKKYLKYIFDVFSEALPAVQNQLINSFPIIKDAYFINMLIKLQESASDEELRKSISQYLKRLT